MRYFMNVFKMVSAKMLYCVQMFLLKVKPMHNFIKQTNKPKNKQANNM